MGAAIYVYQTISGCLDRGESAHFAKTCRIFTGTGLTEKPVTLAIQEVADGKLDARNMDLTIEEPEDLQPAEEEAQ